MPAGEPSPAAFKICRVGAEAITMVFGHNVEVRRAVLHVGIVVAFIGMAARIQVDRGQPPGAYGATMQSPLVLLAITLGCLALVVAAAFLVRRSRISTTATS